MLIMVQLLVVTVSCSSGTNGCCKRFTADSLHVGPRFKHANPAYHWWPHTWWHLYCMWPLKLFVVSIGNALLVTDTHTKTEPWKNTATRSSVCMCLLAAQNSTESIECKVEKVETHRPHHHGTNSRQTKAIQNTTNKRNDTNKKNNKTNRTEMYGTSKEQENNQNNTRQHTNKHKSQGQRKTTN